MNLVIVIGSMIVSATAATNPITAADNALAGQVVEGPASWPGPRSGTTY